MTLGQARTVRLKRLFRRRDVTGRTDLPLLSVYRDLGVVQREGRDDNFNRPSEDLAAYQMVRPGDLVLNKMKTWQGSLGISAYEGIVSPAYFVGEPLSTDNRRFLHHLLRSQPMIAEYGKRSKGIRPSQWDLPWEEFLDIEIHLPPLGVQEAGADFLDRETTRIDALIAAKGRMIDALDERQRSLIESLSTQLADGVLPLRRFISRVVQGWSPDSDGHPADEDEWGVVKAGCVKRMVFDADENKALSADLEIRTDLEIHEGDLLVNRASGSTDLVGNAAIADHVRPKLMLCDKVFRLDARPGVNPRFLMYAISSPTGRAFIEPRLTGNPGTAYNLAQDVLLSIPVPTISVEDRERFVLLLNEAQRLSLRSSAALQQQIGLLQEHRAALITATVTGMRQMPGAVS